MIFKKLYFSLQMLLLVMLLGGCVSATKVVRNEQAEIKNYEFAYFIPPKEDPREIVPRFVSELEGMGLHVQLVDPEKSSQGSQGTGFVVSDKGYVLTCAHVIGKENEATLWIDGNRYHALVTKKDKELDLALMKIKEEGLSTFTALHLRNEPTKLGEDIFVMGYPMSNFLGTNVRLSKGLISSSKGLKGDGNQVQISAEIQPGNSGGPVLDVNGQVVGVVQQTLNPWKMMMHSGGALPQNVNFAIKNNVVLDFLASEKAELGEVVAGNKEIDFSTSEKSVVRLKSGILPGDLEDKPKLLVKLEYKSIWDMWYRFRYLAVSFYDFDTQELLFVAGQDRDNVISDLDVVMKDTMEKIKSLLVK